MELSKQIKKYRTDKNLSQEELAEKVYVTRQTISNWENDKSYPDVHSLLLLSSLFNISLDQLIKGDIETMKEEINKDEIRKFNQESTIFTFLLILVLLSVIPLIHFLGGYGIAVLVVVYAAALYFSLRVEKYKKKYDIQTYKEILAFKEGKKLDEIEKAKEEGKRPYQKVLLALASAVIAMIVSMLFASVLRAVGV
ncbi:MAG: helix-turn-helix domain-containing protein [Roseburia sp.]|nr:helix-turn-helix domain-containing protein [Roseburia sp.]MCM1241488.1 helix-turn-helix domain-containing protein [Roseburia sp.]